MRAISSVLVILFLIPVLAYLLYTPKDFCREAEIAIGLKADYEFRLGMTVIKYKMLSKHEQLKLWKENTEFVTLDIIDDMIYDLTGKCLVFKGMNKFDRFRNDVASGSYFESNNK